MSAEKNYDMFLVIDRRIKLKIDELEKKSENFGMICRICGRFHKYPTKESKRNQTCFRCRAKYPEQAKLYIIKNL